MQSNAQEKDFNGRKCKELEKQSQKYSDEAVGVNIFLLKNLTS